LACGKIDGLQDKLIGLQRQSKKPQGARKNHSQRYASIDPEAAQEGETDQVRGGQAALGGDSRFLLVAAEVERCGSHPVVQELKVRVNHAPGQLKEPRDGLLHERRLARGICKEEVRAAGHRKMIAIAGVLCDLPCPGKRRVRLWMQSPRVKK